MKKIKFGIFVTGTALMISFMSSCYYDKADLLYGGATGPCTDTSTTVSYTLKVVPLFQRYCYSCHGGTFPSGNIQMGTYATDKAVAQSGRLYGSVSYGPGYFAMPQGSPKLSTCQIADIKKWIDGGLLNN
jgi:hypothetical protein